MTLLTNMLMMSAPIFKFMRPPPNNSPSSFSSPQVSPLNLTGLTPHPSQVPKAFNVKTAMTRVSVVHDISTVNSDCPQPRSTTTDKFITSPPPSCRPDSFSVQPKIVYPSKESCQKLV